nr:MAG TPA: hypothetical protein [Caudoviricetes sp.]
MVITRTEQGVQGDTSYERQKKLRFFRHHLPHCQGNKCFNFGKQIKYLTNILLFQR